MPVHSKTLILIISLSNSFARSHPFFYAFSPVFIRFSSPALSLAYNYANIRRRMYIIWNTRNTFRGT